MARYRIIFFLFMCMGFLAQAQNTTSPYSIFGPGELQSKGFGRSLGMGNAGIALQSGNNLNNLNPASYTGIDSMHFIFEMGIEGKFSGFKSQGKYQAAHFANLKYLAMGFRVTGWWSSSLGLTPFSNVGYNIMTKNYIEGSNLTYTSKYTGSGGINQAYISNSIKIAKNLAFGINTSYMFGSLIQEELVSQSLLPSFIIGRTDYLHSFYFDYGLQYSFKLKKALSYSIGLIYSNQQSLNSKHVVSISDESYNLMQTKESKTDYLKIPSIYGIGIGIQNGVRFTLAADYKFQKWSSVDYPNRLDKFVDSHDFTVGAEFRPWPISITNAFYKNWLYRIGVNYHSSYLNVRNNVLDEKNLSIGLGIPLRTSGSYMNMAFKYGKKGSTAHNQIKENYFMFHLNFSINEIWFFKKIYY